MILYENELLCLTLVQIALDVFKIPPHTRKKLNRSAAYINMKTCKVDDLKSM